MRVRREAKIRVRREGQTANAAGKTTEKTTENRDTARHHFDYVFLYICFYKKSLIIRLVLLLIRRELLTIRRREPVTNPIRLRSESSCGSPGPVCTTVQFSVHAA